MLNKKRIVTMFIIIFLTQGMNSMAAVLPDLTVQTITWNPLHPVVGSTATFTVTIKNLGDGDAPASSINYYVDGSKVGSGYLNSLSTGGSTTANFNWNVLQGNHSIKATIDPDNRIVESDEGNNDNAVSFTGIPSDLTVSDITWNPFHPVVGSIATFTVTIKNLGDGDAPASSINYYVDGSKVGSGYLNSLSTGGSTTANFNWNVLPGNHSIKATVDPDNRIVESDEGNNDNAVSFTGIPSDLTVSDITWNPFHPVVGSIATFTVTIKNLGDGDAPGSSVNYYVDGSKASSRYTNALSAGGSTTANFNWNVLPGNHSIKATVDPDNRIAESDEANNDNTVNFVGIPSDLIVSDIIWNPLLPAVGSVVTFTTTIKNLGSGDAPASSINYYVDGSKVGSGYLNSLSTGGSTAANFNWNVLQGNHSIKATIDPDNRIIESDETNNDDTINFVGIPSDLIVSDIVYNPKNIVAGGNVAFVITIKNQGEGDAIGSSASYYIDNSKVGSGYLNALSSGGSTTINFNWNARLGSNSLKIVADSDSKIAENDESNNEKTINFVVSPAPEITVATPRPTGIAVVIPEQTSNIVATPTKTYTKYITERTDENPKTASVSLYGEKTDVTLGEEVLSKLSAVNIIGNDIMHVQVILIPPSGWSVTSTEFSKGMAGQYVTMYNLTPEDGSRDIEVRIMPNQIGDDFKLNGRIIYYFGDNLTTREDHPLSMSMKVRRKQGDVVYTPYVQPTYIPQPTYTPGPQLTIPGFTMETAIGILFMTLFVIKRYRFFGK